MRRFGFVFLAVLGGCHYHRDTNAPGIVDVASPPANAASPELEYPGDPGEQMVTLSTGVLGGGGGGTSAPHGVGDFAVEATLNWGCNEHSHNDNDSRMFIPRGALWPERGYGVTLGWSALRILGGDFGESADAETGPLYAELQMIRSPAAVGAGWAVQPTTGDHGPQLNLLLGVVFFRTRYMLDGGIEFHLGYQLKIPTTWVWSR